MGWGLQRRQPEKGGKEIGVSWHNTFEGEWRCWFNMGIPRESGVYCFIFLISSPKLYRNQRVNGLLSHRARSSSDTMAC